MEETYSSSDEESQKSPGLMVDVLQSTNIPLEAPKRIRKSESWILPGEKIEHKESTVGYLSPIGKLYGSVVITNYRLRFRSKDQTASGKNVKQCEFSVPLGAISRVEKIGHSNVSRGEDAYGLEILCKDMRNIKLSSRQENHSRRPLFEALQKFAFPLTNKIHCFAFSYAEKFKHDGWSVYDPVREYKRMGVPNDTWVLTKINERYDFSDSYPSTLCVPAQAVQNGEEFLDKVKDFRSKKRIPVLSWLHPETNASMSRCAQPLVGMTARRSTEDELYTQMIIEANAQSAKLFIMDARPEVNAKVNKAKGGGYEGEEAYKDMDLVFLDIQNIHVMRERIDDKTWLSSLDDTNWLEHIKLILLGAARIVDKMENHKTSVLVHCSDGWDRTAQLTGLSMIMLDSYYRTITGFEVLVEKEWCSFGHKFAQRIGHGEDKHSDAERSPVFLQFIDAVWQLTDQFPTAFEFNQIFLITILDELYSCRFGTFLMNNEQERVKNGLREKTKSVWSMINSDVEGYSNPLYNPGTGLHVLIPCCSQRRIKLWKEYYLRYNPAVSAQERMRELNDVYRQMLRVRDQLQGEVERLRKEQMAATASPKTPSTSAQV